MMDSVLSVIAGYVAMAVIVMVGSLVAASAMIPGGFKGARTLQGPPPRNYLVANLALSFVAALVGGWLTARLAPSSPLMHAGVLAALLIVMGAVSARTQRTHQPKGYPLLIGVIGVAGVIAGALWTVSSAAS